MAKVEDVSRYVNFKFDRFSGILEVEGDKTPKAVIEFGQIPQAHIRLPNSDRRPILTKDQMRDLKVYNKLSERELALRAGIEWTRESEGPTGDSISSERSYAYATAEAESEDNFKIATRTLIERGIGPEYLKESVREAGLRMPEGKRMGEIDDTVSFQIETMQEEIEMIEAEMKNGPQR